jgi:anti-sigma factor RsiW
MSPMTTQIERTGDEELACRELVELVTEYLDGALDPAARARVDAHLAACDGCTTYVDQLRAVIAAAPRIVPEPVPPALMERLLKAFRAGRSGM